MGFEITIFRFKFCVLIILLCCLYGNIMFSGLIFEFFYKVLIDYIDSRVSIYYLDCWKYIYKVFIELYF